MEWVGGERTPPNLISRTLPPETSMVGCWSLPPRSLAVGSWRIRFGGVHSPPTHSTYLLPRALTLSPSSPPPKHPLDPPPLLEICPVDRGHLHHPRYLPHPPFIWLVQIMHFAHFVGITSSWFCCGEINVYDAFRVMFVL